MQTDTIAAIATAVSDSGIGIIRISGSDALLVADKVYRSPKNQKKLSQAASHTIHYGYIYDEDELIDEVMVAVMLSPHSYTTEDTVEINCHGGILVMNRILETVLHHGARLAQPGEFTKRAFLNGRIDLSKAEAVMDLIHSKNEFAMKASVNQLKGSVSAKVRSLREDILYEIAFIESALDDPEHISLEGYPDKLMAKTRGLSQELKKLIDSADNGKMLKDGIRTVILGKPNAGKSSLLNVLVGEDKAIVTSVAGTTRDAIDTEIVHNGKEYVFIDTAGLRRKNKIKEELERYSIIRTVSAVERADVVLMVIDATEGVTEQDAKIAGIAHERGKGVIIVVNKWDAIEKNDKTMREYEAKIRQVLSYMPYAEIMYVSAMTGQRLPKLYDMIDMVIENQTLRIATGVLNEIMTEAVAMQQPPSDKGKRLKLYYITQVAVQPPTFVIFVNDKELMHFSYVRYLENRIREAFGFRGTALKFITRERSGKDAE
mgnify:CR=1 FL=1